MPEPSEAPEQRGFTLLEVLIALVVLGLLMVALTQGVRAGLSLRQAQVSRLDRTAELDATMRGLRTVLGSIATIPGGVRNIATEGNTPTFRGEAEQVNFIGAMPTGLGSSRRGDMDLHLNNGHLILSWTPHRHVRLLGPPPAPTEAVLLDNVKRLQLAYWGAPSRGEPAAWQSRWESPQAPELIRVELAFGQGDQRRWPGLIVAAQP
jgi:general secretion pathway protein J